MKDGVYTATLTIDGEAIEGQLVVRGGTFEGVGRLAGLKGTVTGTAEVVQFVIAERPANRLN